MPVHCSLEETKLLFSSNAQRGLVAFAMPKFHKNALTIARKKVEILTRRGGKEKGASKRAVATETNPTDS